MKLLSKDKLIMKVLVGNVEDNPDGVNSICVTMSNAPIIGFEDGTRVIFSWKELCEMAVDFKKKEEKANKKSPCTDQSIRTKNI